MTSANYPQTNYYSSIIVQQPYPIDVSAYTLINFQITRCVLLAQPLTLQFNSLPSHVILILNPPALQSVDIYPLALLHDAVPDLK